MPWFNGSPLLEYLEAVKISGASEKPLRLPVQYVIRPNQDFRGYSGRIVSGRLDRGQTVKILPSRQETTVEEILIGSEKIDSAVCGQSVTIKVSGDYDISRSDFITDAAQPAEIADQFRAHIIWMQDQEMLPGRSYFLRTETGTFNCKIGNRATGSMSTTLVLYRQIL